MKLLILYYSRTGNNRLLAEHLASLLGSDIEEIRPIRKFKLLGFLLDFFKNRRPKISPIVANPRDYDHILFVAPLFDMGIAHPIKTAIASLKSQLGPYSFVTLCGHKREGQAEHVHAELLELTGAEPAHIQQMWVSELLPEDQADTMKSSRYKIADEDLDVFADEIAEIRSWFALSPDGYLQRDSSR